MNGVAFGIDALAGLDASALSGLLLPIGIVAAAGAIAALMTMSMRTAARVASPIDRRVEHVRQRLVRGEISVDEYTRIVEVLTT